MCACVSLCHGARMDEKNLWDLVLPFHYVGSGYHDQAVRLGGKHLYLLVHLSLPQTFQIQGNMAGGGAQFYLCINQAWLHTPLIRALEIEAGGLENQGHPGLHKRLEASLGYTRPPFPDKIEYCFCSLFCHCLLWPRPVPLNFIPRPESLQEQCRRG